MANSKLKIVMATKEMIAIISAVMGNKGYIGTLNGRSNNGSFFLSRNCDIIDMIYKVNAPNTEMVMISAVLPVSKAMIPMTIFISKALDGV